MAGWRGRYYKLSEYWSIADTIKGIDMIDRARATIQVASDSRRETHVLRFTTSPVRCTRGIENTHLHVLPANQIVAQQTRPAPPEYHTTR